MYNSKQIYNRNKAVSFVKFYQLTLNIKQYGTRQIQVGAWLLLSIVVIVVEWLNTGLLYTYKKITPSALGSQVRILSIIIIDNKCFIYL